MDANNLTDKINVKLVAVVVLVLLLVIAGAGYALLTFISSGGSSEPDASNYNLQYEQGNNSVVASQTGGENVVSESLVVEITYQDGTTQSEDVQLDGIGQPYYVSLNQDASNADKIQLLWKGDTNTLLNQLETSEIGSDDQSNSGSNIEVSVDNMEYSSTDTISLSASDYISGEYSTIQSAEWSIGDNFVFSQNEILVPQDTLSEPGEYTGNLTVTINDEEYSDEFTVTITGGNNTNETDDGIDDGNDTNETDDGIDDGNDTNETDDGIDDGNDTNETSSLSANISVDSINDTEVVFNASDTVVPDDNNISTYEWIPSSGSSLSQNMNETFTYEYDENGEYVAEVTVKTESGLSDTSTVSVNLTSSESNSEDNDSQETTDEEPDVTIELDNDGDNYWKVVSIDGSSESDVLGPDDNFRDENPSLSLDVGTRYEFVGIPNSKWSEDLSLDITDSVRNPLLSQEGDGEYDDNNSVNLETTNTSIEFTITEDLGSEMSGYISPNNSDMRGSINAE